MELEAALTVATNAAIAIFGFIFLAVSRTSASLAFAYAAGSGVGLAIAAYSLRKHVGNLLQGFNHSLVIPIFKTAWPFGLIGIMGIVMLNTDIVMLGWLRSAPEVGYYAAAQKFVQLLYVLPALLAVSIFPTITRLVSVHRSIRSIVSRSLTAVLAVAVPLAALGIALASIIILFFFGNAYVPAIAPFRILMLSLIFVYPSTILSHVVFAYGAERRILGIVGWTIFGNAFFNLLLIPAYGIIGAAIATIIVQSVTNLMFWNIVYRVSGVSVLDCFGRRS
jgi:PST family polysaccharide transporter